MSYTVFARKYRPQTFEEIVGQDHIVRTLKNAIAQNRLAQAYLFVGPRGTGKTSSARIFAKALNCVNGPTPTPCGVCALCQEIADGNSLNVMEFDAASNTQVDKIREIIIENVRYMPTGGAKYKLYIVDEVHMLSTSSFNALLKTLEEPPAHVKFVFATTDVQKVPSTIISRCQRFDLRRIPRAEIARHLLYIAGKENLTLAAAAADTIARGAEGGLRDAESMLDQLVAFCGNEISEENVLDVFGFTGQETVAGLCESVMGGASAAALQVIYGQSEAGKDLSRLMGDLIVHLRNLLVVQHDPRGMADELSAEATAALLEQSGRISTGQLLELIEQFAQAEGRMKWATNKKMHMEIAVIRAIQTLGQVTLTEVLETLTALRGGGALPEKREVKSVGVKVVAPRVVAAKVPVTMATPAAVETGRVELVRGSLVAAAKAEMAAQAPAPVEAKVEAKVEAIPPVVVAKVEAVVPVSVPADLVLQEVPEVPEVAIDLGVPALGDIWTRFVEAVRRARPFIAGYVETGQLIDLSNGMATIAFPPDGTLPMSYCERSPNKEYIVELFSQLVGKPTGLKCVKKEGLVIEKIAPSEVKVEVAVDPLIAFKDDPLIRKALEIFQAEIIAN